MFWIDLPMPELRQIEGYLARNSWKADMTSSSRGCVWYNEAGNRILILFPIEPDEIPGHVRDLLTSLARIENRSKAQVYLDVMEVGR